SCRFDTRYPGGAGFADFLAFDFQRGHLAVYTANASETIHPVLLGLVDNRPSGNLPGAHCAGVTDLPSQPNDSSFVVIHSFDTAVGSGATYEGPVVRLDVGGGVPQTLDRFRASS